MMSSAVPAHVLVVETERRESAGSRMLVIEDVSGRDEARECLLGGGAAQVQDDGAFAAVETQE